MPVRRPKSTKNPPIFSHEFVIQNHADIVSCIAMIFVIGLMFQASSPVASLFVAMQHNVTINETAEQEPATFYTYGIKDLFTTFFYLLICIVIHAVIQEYILDKVNRKMHLSKVKHSKFNESGQLLVFYGVSAAWGCDIMIRENYFLNIGSLWEGYPHLLPFVSKFYFIIQIAYWIHCFPELYFQKVKKEEMSGRIQYISLYLVLITGAYLLNFTRVAMCLLVLHYTVEFVFHFARLLYFADKQQLANTGFLVWDVLFVVVRLGTITLAVLTFWYGLDKTNQDALSVSEGNFNTRLIRVNCLAVVCLLQAWMMWNFITFHLRRLRDHSSSVGASRRTPASPTSQRRMKKKGKRDEDSGGEELTDSPRSGATENGSVRQRSLRAKRQ